MSYTKINKYLEHTADEFSPERVVCWVSFLMRIMEMLYGCNQKCCMYRDLFVSIDSLLKFCVCRKKRSNAMALNKITILMEHACATFCSENFESIDITTGKEAACLVFTE